MRASKTVVAIKKLIAHGDPLVCQQEFNEAREFGLISREDVQALFGEAASKGAPALCDIFLAAGADINANDHLGRNALQKAIDNRSISFTRYVLKKGGLPNTRNERGQTPLHLVHMAHSIVRKPKETTLCSLLLERGADIHVVCNDFRVPLHNAVLDQNVDTAGLLIAAGADPSFVPPSPPDGYLTPFQMAVDLGNVVMARFFIRECGVDLGQKTECGRTLFQLSRNLLIKRELLAIQTSLEVDAAMGGQVDDGACVSRSPKGPLL
jgi:ankyrin repeat protein